MRIRLSVHMRTGINYETTLSMMRTYVFFHFKLNSLFHSIKLVEFTNSRQKYQRTLNC